MTQADIDKAVEAALEGVRAKNTELLDELKQTKAELRKSKDIDPADVARIEEERDTLKAELAKATKAATDAAKRAETAEKTLAAESGYTSKLLTENALNTALAEAGVKEPAMLKAVKAMMAGTAQVVTEGDQRTVKIGDKALVDHIKEWSGTDEAKFFISAATNAGGGANGSGKGDTGGKTVTRAQFDGMEPLARTTFAKEGGKVVDIAA
ncbi:MAG: hypothetical protein ACKVOB_13510 [Sphingomonas sp.]